MSGQPRRKRRQLSPEEKWQVFLEVTSGELTQTDAARKWGVDVSTVIKLRKLARDGALAAFAASKPGRARPVDPRVVAELEAENVRLTEAVKELAVELSLLRGKLAGVEPGRCGSAPCSRRDQRGPVEAGRRRHLPRMATCPSDGRVGGLRCAGPPVADPRSARRAL